MQKLQETCLEIKNLIKLLQEVNQKKKTKKVEKIYILPENGQQIINDLRLF